MKIILTEEQLKLVKLIKENTDFTEKMIEAIKSLGSDADKLYNVLTFSTVAEIRDGDTDISVAEQKFDKLDDRYDILNRKVSDFEQRYSDDGEFKNIGMEEIYHDLDMRVYNLKPKLDALGLLINALLPLSKVDKYGEGRDTDMHGPFNDIKPMDI